jgi:hypothetical protein
LPPEVVVKSSEVIPSPPKIPEAKGAPASGEITVRATDVIPSPPKVVGSRPPAPPAPSTKPSEPEFAAQRRQDGATPKAAGEPTAPTRPRDWYEYFSGAYEGRRQMEVQAAEDKAASRKQTLELNDLLLEEERQRRDVRRKMIDLYNQYESAPEKERPALMQRIRSLESIYYGRSFESRGETKYPTAQVQNIMAGLGIPLKPEAELTDDERRRISDVMSAERDLKTKRMNEIISRAKEASKGMSSGERRAFLTEIKPIEDRVSDIRLRLDILSKTVPQTPDIINEKERLIEELGRLENVMEQLVSVTGLPGLGTAVSSGFKVGDYYQLEDGSIHRIKEIRRDGKLVLDRTPVPAR